MIANTIINNKDVFNDAIAGGDSDTEPETDSDSDWASDEDPASDDELVIDEVEELYYELQPAEGAKAGSDHVSQKSSQGETATMLTPSPPKKKRRTMMLGSNSCNDKYGLIKQCFPGIDLSSVQSAKDIDKLLVEIIALKQKQSGSNLLLNVRNGMNGSVANYVKVPTHSSDKAFKKYSACINLAVSINGKKTHRSKVQRGWQVISGVNTVVCWKKQ